MSAKGFISAVAYGAAATLGAILAKKGVDAMSDPYKRAKVKRKVKNIKNAIIEKD